MTICHNAQLSRKVKELVIMKHRHGGKVQNTAKLLNIQK